MRVCSVPGCSTIYDSTASRCDTHTRAADKQRGTATQRGYTSAGHQTFRTAVLTRDRICVICNTAEATIADHWPRSRRDLIEAGLNPNDPQHGRGLCKPDHDRETARHQPGGWAHHN